MRDFEYDTGRDYPAARNQAVPQQVPMLDEFTNRIRSATVQAGLILERTTCLGDRAFGSQPEPGSTGEKAGISQEGAVDRVFCALSDLDAVLARLEHAENRIDGLA